MPVEVGLNRLLICKVFFRSKKTTTCSLERLVLCKEDLLLSEMEP